jgi:putative molybdopterin biosynthesis protein
LGSDLLNALDVAEMLNISRNTVYELIKRGELHSSKIGKQVRVRRDDVESYLRGDKSGDPLTIGTNNVYDFISKNYNVPAYTRSSDENYQNNDMIICGQDISLDILANHLGTMTKTAHIYRSYLGSYNGIYELYQGRVNVATAHLWDGDTGEYNISYVKKMLPGVPALIMRIGQRKQGFYVPKNNPKGITGWSDLTRKDISIVNREKGSGTRVLLDEKLRLMGVFGDYIDGYSRECKSHLVVASTIARGGADVGIGSENGCQNIHGVEFIPLQTECYDLVIRLADAEKPPYRAVLEIVASDMFKLDLQSIGGLDTSETGKLIMP